MIWLFLWKTLSLFHDLKGFLDINKLYKYLRCNTRNRHYQGEALAKMEQQKWIENKGQNKEEFEHKNNVIIFVRFDGFAYF